MYLDALVCPNCGAALPPNRAAGTLVRCEYCNTSFRVPRSLTPEPDMGDLLLGADFSRKPVVGWAFPNEDNVTLVPGSPSELRVKFAPADMLNYVLNSTGHFDDVDASVSMRFYEGELKRIDGGISLRYQRGVGSYVFLLSPLGTYSVGCYVPSADGSSMDWKSLLGWTEHAAIRQGLNQLNRLRVTASGDRFRMYINGVLATTMHDTRYVTGQVLLDAEGSRSSPIDAGFTDLQLRDVR